MSSPALAAPLAAQRENTRLSAAAGNASREQSLDEMARQQVNQNDIAQLAYVLWQRRGCPDGSAEIDWLEAETQLRK
jgi:hypothetical protein